jgi:hypothetical protein
VFAYVRHFHLSLIFGGKAGSQQLELDTFSCFTLKAPGVPVNARPWCKYLTLANTLAYYDATTTIISVKHFIVQVFGITPLP